MRILKRYALVILLLLPFVGFALAEDSPFEELARGRASDLRLSVYITAGSVAQIAQDTEARAASLRVLPSLGISKAYIEFYRGGNVIPPASLVLVRDHFENAGIGVAGGIATVPGGGFGVAADAGLDWFNYQNPKTQADLEQVIRAAAPVFDEIIVDDFLCSGDLSAESDAARRGRSWSEYRRDLLTALSQRMIIGPAREANPDIQMIIKYPQWYDLFAVYGYDVEREPQLYDRVWVGTETRGANTQRYGFVQPYEGFINYRWIAAVAGAKIGGGWFDHGDCDANDFLDQAYQTVLAGAREIILFQYGDLEGAHPGHALLREHFSRLADLAAAVRASPVTGAVGYKPPNSEAGGDLYIMDFIGMLGVPLVPSPVFPSEADTIFLPTQAASDPGLVQKVRDFAGPGRSVVFTASLLAALSDAGLLFEMSGLESVTPGGGFRAQSIVLDGREIACARPLDLEALIDPGAARVVLEAEVDGRTTPLLTGHEYQGCRFFVLNTHTFSREDFEAVGEVLLSPRRLGLLDLPAEAALEIRKAFHVPGSALLRGPSRVTLQPIPGAGWVVQNYQDAPVAVELVVQEGGSVYAERFSGADLRVAGGIIEATLPARAHFWIQAKESP